MLRGTFFCYTQKEDENLHNNIFRGRAHVREGKYTALYAKSGTMEKQRLLFIKTTACFHLKYTFFFKNYSIFFSA